MSDHMDARVFSIDDGGQDGRRLFILLGWQKILLSSCHSTNCPALNPYLVYFSTGGREVQFS